MQAFGTSLTRPWILAGVGIAIALAWVAVWRIGFTWSLPAYLAYAALTALLAVIDLRDKRLPNPVTLAAYPIVGGLLLLPAIADGRWTAYLRAWACAGILLGVYALLAFISPAGMGMGDVKLAGSIGLILGWTSWSAPLWATALGFIIGGLASLALLLAKRANRKSEIPFGPSMLLGAWLVVGF